MRFVTTILIAAAAAGLAACGAATSAIPPGELGITARDAFLEARTIARSWEGDARLRWVEGEGVSRTGRVLPGAGGWRFHYTAPDRRQELVVTITPTAEASEESAITSPPGYIIGDNGLGSDWIDSPDVMAAVVRDADAPAEGTASLVLVPSNPPRWLVRFEEGTRRYAVHAVTGALLP